ncbi:hypothetical protein SAMN05216429_102238 [Marinobacter persicus]|uniref:DNA-binding protein n=1 Tax=Marinobacter persicus TaxID=930118 RepID=A0A1I3R639_9GAMM|nr:DNA-binding protein [Marinobacter persicus]GHD43478.1 hypothetical protein GCM10008110_07470 [Marinobacter persicus]SFJ40817.1 hypothetical protein SAMN05216429_102238 [Marinobacter persicus]
MIRDRIIEIFDTLDLTSKKMEELTGIDRYKWGNIRGRKQKVNEDYLEALNQVFPQLSYWIMTGKTIPEVGQISPEMEKARSENSLKIG